MPLEDVLQFKSKRHPELQALRGRLDEVVSAIANDPERDVAQAREIKVLQEAIADHLRVSKETRFPFRLTGVKATIDRGTWSGAAAGFVGAQQFGMPPEIAALAGVAGAVLFSLKSEVGWREAPPGSPYEYVSRFHRDLLV